MSSPEREKEKIAIQSLMEFIQENYGSGNNGGNKQETKEKENESIRK